MLNAAKKHSHRRTASHSPWHSSAREEDAEVVAQGEGQEMMKLLQLCQDSHEPQVVVEKIAEEGRHKGHDEKEKERIPLLNCGRVFGEYFEIAEVRVLREVGVVRQYGLGEGRSGLRAGRQRMKYQSGQQRFSGMADPFWDCSIVLA